MRASSYDVLIVGGGHTGAQTAIALRAGGFSGSIGIVGEEADLPYDRPSLSKDYLAGDKDQSRIRLRPDTFWRERQVDLVVGRRVETLDVENHLAACAGGDAFRYGKLVWAAGGRARALPCTGAGLRGVHLLRSRQHADAIRTALEGAHRVVVVGGGYLGLEVAATLTKSGKHVTVLEAAARVLSRVAAAPLSTFYETEHRRRGVDIRTGACVAELLGDGAVRGVRLADGSEIPADLVVAAIGIETNIAPLVEAGAECGAGGVCIDANYRTSLSDVLAIGDCATHQNRYAGGACVRLESIQNANDMAKTAAELLLGREKRYDAMPWFWSNQFDIKLQTVGLAHDYDRTILRGDPAAGAFTLGYFKASRVVALDCVGRSKDFMTGRDLIEDCAEIDLARFADPDVLLPTLIG